MTMGMNYHRCYGNTSYAEEHHAAFRKMMIWWFDFEKPSRWWRGGEKEKGTRGRNDWEKEERNEAGLDSRRLAAVLRTIWVTPVFLWGEQKHLICHSFHFHSNTCKSFAFCQFYLFLSFLRMPLHFLNDNSVAISLAVHRPGHSVTCVQGCENDKSLLQTCWFFFLFFPPQKSFSPSPTVPLLLSGFPHDLPPQSPDQIQIFATWPLRDPRTAQWRPPPPRGPLFGSCVSPLHGNKWASRSIVTMISCRRWEWGTTELLLFYARYIQKSKHLHEFKMWKTSKETLDPEAEEVWIYQLYGAGIIRPLEMKNGGLWSILASAALVNISGRSWEI